MTNYAFRLLNVFAEETLGGNPLCVFENATGMSDEQMQALALQFNLSETVFVLPSDVATTRMRIFTPDTEMPFAGHPSLGTAQVVGSLSNSSQITLECKAGLVEVQLENGIWTLTTPHKGEPVVKASGLSVAQAASLLGLDESDIHSVPLWINTGSEQMLLPLNSREAVLRATPDVSKLPVWPANSLGRKSVYVFSFDGLSSSEDRLGVTARYFFAKQGGGFAEDPGTGSACANLGGWWQHQRRELPASMRIAQGAQVRRPCQLYLDVAADKSIQVGGKVIEIAQGQLQI
ncbi:PhzF family phenazine biosynthesis protein [Undibacterium sp. Ji42W]|uniref:PhzF family phenazine biosynthesis protein n=1 Tax=Undibacterium sp. Ji42W TaxID=3413039 RepID=UPI003BF1CD76